MRERLAWKARRAAGAEEHAEEAMRTPSGRRLRGAPSKRGALAWRSAVLPGALLLVVSSLALAARCRVGAGAVALGGRPAEVSFEADVVVVQRGDVFPGPREQLPLQALQFGRRGVLGNRRCRSKHPRRARRPPAGAGAAAARVVGSATVAGHHAPVCAQQRGRLVMAASLCVDEGGSSRVLQAVWTRTDVCHDPLDQQKLESSLPCPMSC